MSSQTGLMFRKPVGKTNTARANGYDEANLRSAWCTVGGIGTAFRT